MWHDLDPKRWPAHSPLIDKKVLKRILVGPKEGDTAPGQYTEEYNQDEGGENELTKLPLILDADSSQYSALIDALSLKDGLVIEGPPGTGKSQTISNLIAAALEKGLSILFVAEKMAALSVVFNRLERAGLGEFCLQLHGLKTNKKELLSSLKDRLELKVKSPADLFLRESELDLTKKELLEFSKVMSERVGPEGIPLYDVPWVIEKLKQKMPEDYQRITIDNLDAMTFESFRNAINLLDDLGKEWDSIPIEARNHWQGFVPEKYNESQADEIDVLLNNGVTASKRMNDWLDNTQATEYAPSLYHINRLLRLSELNANEALPDIPSGIRIQFVHNIIHENMVNSYSNTLLKVEEYLSLVKEVNEVFDYASSKSDFYTELLEKHFNILSDVCCGSETLIFDLPKEHDVIEEVISTLNSFVEISSPITELTDKILRTIDDYKALIKLADHLSNGPVELSLHAHEFHIKSTVNNYLILAQAKSNELQKDAQDLSSFNLENEVETEIVRQSYQAINEQLESWFPIFSKEYRKGKKYIRRAMKLPKEFSRENGFPDEIKKLLEYCADRDEADSSHKCNT